MTTSAAPRCFSAAVAADDYGGGVAAAKGVPYSRLTVGVPADTETKILSTVQTMVEERVAEALKGVRPASHSPGSAAPRPQGSSWAQGGAIVRAR